MPAYCGKILAIHGLSQGERIARVLSAALLAVEPGAAVSRQVSWDGQTLRIANNAYALAPDQRIFVIGAGKAGLAMGRAASRILGDRLAGGVVITKGSPLVEGRMRYLQGGHPVPDERSQAATREIAALLGQLQPEDIVLCLISGGGSALMTLPVEGVSLADMQALTRTLLACGASIGEINTLRKHLDRVKGGGLAAMASPASLACLILSDVVGSPLEVIASGPTVADSSTYHDAVHILRKYVAEKQVPEAVTRVLDAGCRGELVETLKAGDEQLARVFNVLVGSNEQAALAAVDQARQEGLNALLLTTYLQGEAAHAGAFLASILRQQAGGSWPLQRPACIVVGGETTVVLRGSGLGGRNQELALAAVREMAGLPNVALVTLATDGEDGPTNAAGAWVTGSTLQQAADKDFDPADFLRRNDAYHFFEGLDSLIITGQTGTNVNDLAFLFAF